MLSFRGILGLVKELKLSKPQHRHDGRSDMPRAVSSYLEGV